MFLFVGCVVQRLKLVDGEGNSSGICAFHLTAGLVDDVFLVRAGDRLFSKTCVFDLCVFYSLYI